MNLTDRIQLLQKLADYLLSKDSETWRTDLAKYAEMQNPWFTVEYCLLSFENIASAFLQKANIEAWVKHYKIDSQQPKTIGLIMAGNIPMVGFHDWLCCFICGHRMKIKYSSKDDRLLPAIIHKLSTWDKSILSISETVHRISDIDAIIATGSNNSARYFEQYFGHMPNIIRMNRTSIGIINGQETKEQLKGLSQDIMEYFGLGCRSISKLFIPENYNLDHIFEFLVDYKHFINHGKFQNNFSYNNAIYLMNQETFLTNNVIILKEDESLYSRIACIHFSYYSETKDIKEYIDQHQDQIQCVVSNDPIEGVDIVPMGQTQRPSLMDYADGVDTMSFLTNIA